VAACGAQQDRLAQIRIPQDAAYGIKVGVRYGRSPECVPGRGNHEPLRRPALQDQVEQELGSRVVRSKRDLGNRLRYLQNLLLDRDETHAAEEFLGAVKVARTEHAVAWESAK
jgi:hypothetical protein